MRQAHSTKALSPNATMRRKPLIQGSLSIVVCYALFYIATVYTLGYGVWRGSGNGGHHEVGQGRGAEVSEAHHEEIWPAAERVTDGLCSYPAAERDRQRRSPRGWSSPQQSGGEFASAFSTTRASHAAVPKRQDAPEIQLSSCSGPQPLQPGTSSRRPRNLQTETLGRARRVARAHCLIAAWVWASCVTHRRPAGGLPLV